MKSVYKKTLSFIVSLSLLASTIVGALCVNLKKASAAYSSAVFLKDLKHYVNLTFNDSTIDGFFNFVSQYVNRQDCCVCCLTSQDDATKFVMSVYRSAISSSYPNAPFAYDGQGRMSWVSYNSLAPYGFGEIGTLYFNSDQSYTCYFRSNVYEYFGYTTSSYDWSNMGHLIPSVASLNLSGYNFFCNLDITQLSSHVGTYSKN